MVQCEEIRRKVLKGVSDQSTENIRGSNQIAFKAQHTIDELNNRVIALQTKNRSFACKKSSHHRERCWSLHDRPSNGGDKASKEEIRIDQIGHMK